MATAKKKKVTKKTTKKKAVKKNPVGRPIKYCPSMCEVVIEKMAEGYSKEAVAGFLDICKDTLYRWAKEYPEFSDSIRKGEAKSRIWWETKLVNHITHTKNGTQINGQVFNLNMKNRFGWSDKKEVTEIDPSKTPKKKFAFTLDEEPEE